LRLLSSIQFGSAAVADGAGAIAASLHCRHGEPGSIGNPTASFEVSPRARTRSSGRRSPSPKAI